MTRNMRYGAASIAVLAALLAASVPASAVELGSIPAGPDSLGLYPASTAALAGCLALITTTGPAAVIAAAACAALFNALWDLCNDRAVYTTWLARAACKTAA